MLGELRVYRNPTGRFSTKQRFITLDESIPDDPEAKRLVDAAASAESDARTKSKRLLNYWLDPSNLRLAAKPPQPDPAKGESSPTYVTSAACSQCHLAQYMKWVNGPHARATDRLQPRWIEFEPSCFKCHATGSTPSTGAEKPDVSRLPNVQCEQCHGPGSDHVAKPGKAYGRVANMQAACADCHTPETSPGFDVQTAWANVKH
jgi:hypothetical protein